MMTQKTAVSHDTTPTKTLLDGALALTMVATVGLAAPAFASEVVTISAIELKGADGARELTIRGSRAPTFSVFRMTAPPRLLVDLSGAELTLRPWRYRRATRSCAPSPRPSWPTSTPRWSASS
jgi:hypothetical protein